jgi:LysR family hydrogen peroxide-inducible transcriptional activator
MAKGSCLGRSRFLTKWTSQIVVHEDTTAQLLKLAQACEIDLALASRPIQDQRMEVKDLFTEELRLALPPGHALTRKRTVSPGDIKHEPFIVMKEGDCLGDQVLNFCERRDLKPTITFRSAQLETVQSLVRSGMGISLVPRWRRGARAQACLAIVRLSDRSPNGRSWQSGLGNVRSVARPMSS